jgi:DNA-binding response OmpR family regulator
VKTIHSAATCPTCSRPVEKREIIAVSDDNRTIVISDGNPIRLSKTEFTLFCMLWRRMPWTLLYETIYTELWADDDEPTDPDNSIKVYMSRFRHALVGTPLAIENVHGLGYRMYRTDLSSTQGRSARIVRALREVAHGG